MRRADQTILIVEHDDPTRELYLRELSRDYCVVACCDEHDVLEVYEDMEAFWFEDPCPPDGRVGHLHRDPQLAQGHPVPCLPLPPDFPI